MPDKSLKNKIDENVKAYGGVNQSVQFASRWIHENLSSNDSKVIQYLSNYMHPGKIHLFNYTPKYSDELSYYDRNPMVLSLGFKEGTDIELGLNLHFIPIRIRWRILNEIMWRYNGKIESAMRATKNGDALRENSVNIEYSVNKSLFERYGALFAIRSYIPTRRFQTKVVSFSAWDKIALANEFRFIRVSASRIYALYNKNK